MAYPSVLEPYAPYITLLLVFIDGLLFGLSVKKGLVSIILLVVALVLAYFVGLDFIPKINILNVIHTVIQYMTTVKFGSLVLSFALILFIVGFGIGAWKG
ncbi:MAG: hypothetical protein LVQ96_05780 [Thermoplasmatales archaeon]|nr:hypothetical protein [Thermoplasmatales archaeon]MCW6170663.1 hypothetical protein [Thermoplasmatales archaeon]